MAQDEDPNVGVQIRVCVDPLVEPRIQSYSLFNMDSVVVAELFKISDRQASHVGRIVPGESVHALKPRRTALSGQLMTKLPIGDVRKTDDGTLPDAEHIA